MWTVVAQKRSENNFFGRMVALPLWVLLLFLSLRYMPPVIATLHIGVATIFLYTLSANYYFVFLALYAGMMVSEYVNRAEYRVKLKEHLIYFAVMLLAVISVVNLSDVPVFQNWAVSFLLLFFIMVSTIAYIPERHRKGAGALISVFFVVTLWLQNVRYADAVVLPGHGATVIADISGNEFADQLKQFPTVQSSLVDVYGHRIVETGIVIPSKTSLDFPLTLGQLPTQSVYLLIRSDVVYPVMLSLDVNDKQNVARTERKRLGGLFDYIQVELPVEMLKPGRNRIRLTLEEGKAFALYHLWFTQGLGKGLDEAL